jgi:signal transduction histidine kinase
MQTFSRTRRSGFEKTSLPAVVREVNQLLRVARGRQIALRYDLQDDTPAVFADRALVSQMLVNLVMNACEAIGGQEGTVTIGVRLARLDADTAVHVRPERLLDEGDYAALWITDSGSGMTPEVEGRAFDPLFSTKAEGRGLGLPAALRIAVSHGGGIRVETAPGAGTTVTVYLPPHFAAGA